MEENKTLERTFQSEEEEVIDLMEIVRLLWAHALQIVAVAVAAAVICLLVCMFALTPKYEASINLIVNARQDASTATFTNDNFNSAKNLISTYAVIIKSNTVLNEVIDILDLDMTYSELYNQVEVESVDSTQIMSVTVTNTDAELAGEIAQTIADIVPDILVEKVEAGSCKTVSDININPNAVFPQTKKYVVIAGLGGAVLVCGVLVMMHLLNNTIVDDQDIEKKLGLSVLGLIPEV